MKKVIFLFLALCILYYIFSDHQTFGGVNQGNISQTICKVGWTATIRPSVSYTNALKKKLLISQKLSGTIADFELDHRVSLELSGSPTDPSNLWMEPYHLNVNGFEEGARVKDRLENRLNSLVCSHQITLAQAVSAIKDWQNSYLKYIGPFPRYASLGSVETFPIDEDDQ